MKLAISIAALLTTAVLIAADPPTDLTRSTADIFRTNIGKTITLRGRLEHGQSGLCLFGATPTNVVFYVRPDMPTSGIYTYPASWERFMHKQVRVTGELRFRTFERTNKHPFMQIPPDYYYLVLQRTKIEGLEPK